MLLVLLVLLDCGDVLLFVRLCMILLDRIGLSGNVKMGQYNSSDIVNSGLLLMLLFI